MKASFVLVPLFSLLVAAGPMLLEREDSTGKTCKYGTDVKGICQATSGGCSGGAFVTRTYAAGDWPCKGATSCCVAGASSSDTTKKTTTTAATTTKAASTGGSGTAGGKTPDNAIALLKVEEGFMANFYGDQDGLRTIGYGHACLGSACDGITAPLTEASATDLLKKDLPTYEKAVCALPNAAALNANQFGALVSFTFNDGTTGASTAWTAKMQAKDFAGIAAALPSTDTDNGVRTTRRQKEQALFNTATSTMSGC